VYIAGVPEKHVALAVRVDVHARVHCILDNADVAAEL
jgi:hypothetical protein